MNKLALLGEYNSTFKPHIATGAAIAHSCSLKSKVESNWISTEDINPSLFEIYSGIWITPGSPYKNMDKLLWAIGYARENHVPCFGTCGGFQHMVIEYARSVLRIEDAQSEENNPDASSLFISRLDCSLAGREMKLTFTKGSKIAAIYDSLTAVEEYYCNFGVNPEYIPQLKSQSLRVSGSDSEGEVRVIEETEHPFFIGTLFVPQTLSTPEVPHPLVTAFVRGRLKRLNGYKRRLSIK